MNKPNLLFKLLLLIIWLFSASCKKADDNEQTIPTPSHPLQSSPDLDLLLENIGNRRVVLLGEASHGTAEFYEWRKAISRPLIEAKGFKIIAVEGEWADSYRINNSIKGPASDSLAALSVLQNYNRWPTCMWGNYHVASPASWMNQQNQGRAAADKAGVFLLKVLRRKLNQASIENC